MSLKAGVRVLGIRPEMVLALRIVEAVYQAHGAPFVITSVMEGTHKRASLHYLGCAADLRLPPHDAASIVAEAKAALGEDFDVILEGDHVHVEFQAKTPY
jgi:hypothetical protein